MSRLTWDDLLIQNFTPEQASDWLAPWSGVFEGLVSPIFLNKFGCWFLRRMGGGVEMLDVFTGRLEQIADDYETFTREVNEVWWQEIYLFSETVLRLHEAGKVPGEGQCYAPAPHPALGGPNPANGDVVDPAYVMVMDVPVWQGISAQSVRPTR